MLHPTYWSKWKKNERIAATIFWPCVLLDEKLTKRRYWPAKFTDAPRTFACEPRLILESEDLTSQPDGRGFLETVCTIPFDRDSPRPFLRGNTRAVSRALWRDG